MTVMQYDRKFHKLSCFAKSLVATEKDRVKRFLNGLEPAIQKDLAIVDLETHAEALDKALKVEMTHEQVKQYLKQNEKKRPYDQEDREAPSSRQKLNNKNGKVNQQKELKCFRCGGDHQIEDCPMEKGVCFRCKKPGHKLKDCLVAKGACFHCKRQGHIAANCPEKAGQF